MAKHRRIYIQYKTYTRHKKDTSGWYNFGLFGNRVCTRGQKSR